MISFLRHIVFFLILILLMGVIVIPSMISPEKISSILQDKRENPIQFKNKKPMNSIGLIVKENVQSELKMVNK